MGNYKKISITAVGTRGFGVWGKHFKHLEENGKNMSSQLGFLKNKLYEDKGIYESYGPHG